MSDIPEKLLIQPHEPRRSYKRYIALLAIALPVAAVIAFGVIVGTSKATINSSANALATISLPTGGATIQKLAAVGGREQKDVPVKLVGTTVWPTHSIPAGETVTIEATIQRPGWNSWLAGKTQKLKLTVTTPEAKLAATYVTVKKGEPVALHFDQPVAEVSYGEPGSKLTDKTVETPTTSFAVPESAEAGTLEVKAVPRTWETAKEQDVSWFPAGAKATAVASPAPGAKLTPTSPITLTFNTPVSKALGGAMPAVTPAGSGTWETLGEHAIRFVPSGYGYGLGATVKINLPAGVNLVGTGNPTGTWSVPNGTTLRLQQLLAELGYLPLNFNGASAGPSVSDQITAAVNPPAGSFTWRYPDTPTALRALWSAGTYGELTKGAVMAFERDQNITTDGAAGPGVWKALIKAALAHQVNASGYTFVQVHEADSGENESTWHDGKVVASGAVNTGTAAAGGTATGVFAVFEHLVSTTMSGVNPDGSKYVDPGIPDVSYFDGGDALHGYIRASYGFPQSDGCVEMPYAEAAEVYPYTPVGTIVDVST